MTGFGIGSVRDERIALTVQVKSVNARFLELRFRMPREYSVLEADIKRLVTQKLHRGTVDISIFRTLEATSESAEIIPNIALAKAWLKACRQLSDQLQMAETPSLESLLRLPEVMQVPEQPELAPWEKQTVLGCVQKAVEACQSERSREGEEQFKIFCGLLAELTNFLDGVKKRKKEIDANLKSKLEERLKAIGSGGPIEPQRLAQEILYLAEKADIDEEITRTEAHLRAYRKLLNETVGIGKKLEFYTQELHREINTIGSKTQALEVTLDVIEAKTIVERLREQVQNVE